MPLIMMVFPCRSTAARQETSGSQIQKTLNRVPGEAQALPCPRLRHLRPAPVRALKTKDMAGADPGRMIPPETLKPMAPEHSNPTADMMQNGPQAQAPDPKPSSSTVCLQAAPRLRGPREPGKEPIRTAPLLRLDSSTHRVFQASNKSQGACDLLAKTNTRFFFLQRRRSKNRSIAG